MRRLVCTALLGLAVASSSGCFIPIYSGDPVRRSRQLINSSENMNTVMDEWERIWFLDQPDHGSPYRTHGGVL